MKNTLDRVLKKDFPDLNTDKIADFYVEFLGILLTITSTIILILTMTWYLPTMYGLDNNKIIIILLALILASNRIKNE